jgi:hypothetical protein
MHNLFHTSNSRLPFAPHETSLAAIASRNELVARGAGHHLTPEQVYIGLANPI